VTDILNINGLKLACFIGTNEWEKKVRQNILLNIALEVDTQKAAQSDDIADALDYYDLSMRLSNYVAETRFNLIEALSSDLARLILEEYEAASVELEIIKPGAVPQAESVSVKLKRSK